MDQKYRDPDGYFLPEIAKEIKMARSFLGDWYWVQKEFKKVQDDEKERLQCLKRGDDKDTVLSLRQNAVLLAKNGLYWKAFKVTIVFVFKCIIYYLLIVGGFATCGWLWPKNLRTKILSVGLTGGNRDSNSSKRQE